MHCLTRNEFEVLDTRGDVCIIPLFPATRLNSVDITKIAASDRQKIHDALKAAIASTPRVAFLFDFDGVLASPTEDCIYRLPSSPSEALELRTLAQHFGLNLEDFDVEYQRHLVFQEAAFAIGRKIEAGPACEAAKWVTDQRAKLFILTARSGRKAIERMQTFLDEQGLYPVELFHVGRVKKDRQLQYLLEKLPNHHLCYVEDNGEMLKKVAASIPEEFAHRVKLIEIQHPACENENLLRDLAESVFEQAVARPATLLATTTP